MERLKQKPLLTILIILGFTHLLNDTLQALVSGVYPILKESMKFNFTQIGIITIVFQFSSSIFQPIIGYYTDKKAQPYTLATGMIFTLLGVFAILLPNEKALQRQ